MKLSIIVPVYNMAAEGKLNYCLDSLLAQTIKDKEIIAVDDASTDESLQILFDYMDRYPNFFHVCHYTDNRRQGGAKNEGLRVAKGDWIGFVDSDDWIAPDYYEKLLEKAEETGADVVGCDYSLVHEHTMETGTVIQNNDLSQTGICDVEKHKKLAMRPGSMVIKIYRHQMIKDHNLDFPEHIFYEDNCAGTIWMLYCKKFEKIEEPLYYYYQNDTSTVHVITERKCRDRMKAGELLVAESAARGFMKEYRDEIEFRFTEIYYATTLFSYMSGVKYPKINFLAELRSGIHQYFPDFEKNKYYVEQMGPEEKKLIKIHSKGSLYFLLYYKALHFYRKMRKNKHS